MGRFVHVYALDILKGVCGDLAQSNSVKDAITLQTDKVTDGVTEGFNVLVKLEFPSPLVDEGQISIACSGVVRSGYVEAQRSSLMALFESLRAKYKFFPADYNYVAVSEKRPLYQAMKTSFEPCAADFVEISGWTKECLIQLEGLCDVLSVWLGDNHDTAGVDNVKAVSAFEGVMRQQCFNIDRCVRHAGRIYDSVVLRICPSEFEYSQDSTVPTPMEISWDRCFHTLQVIYHEAIKKIRGKVQSQFEVRHRAGQFRASVQVSEHPHLFTGEPADTQNGALAKLFYCVIKYVNLDLGYSILDLHAGVRQYQDEYLDRFDRNMKGIKGCSEVLCLLCDETKELFEESRNCLMQKLQIITETDVVFEAASKFSAKVMDCNTSTQEIWQRLQGRQVLRTTLEANVGFQS